MIKKIIPLSCLFLAAAATIVALALSILPDERQEIAHALLAALALGFLSALGMIWAWFANERDMRRERFLNGKETPLGYALPRQAPYSQEGKA